MVLLPRFASTPFRLLATPQCLQNALEDEYKAMSFEPVQEDARLDPSFEAEVVLGISSVRFKTPDLRYSPMFAELMKLAYDQFSHGWSSGLGSRSSEAGAMAFVVMDLGLGCMCIPIGWIPTW